MLLVICLVFWCGGGRVVCGFLLVCVFPTLLLGDGNIGDRLIVEL